MSTKMSTSSSLGVSCLLCKNPNVHVPVDNFYVSKITSLAISSCITYLPKELTSELKDLDSSAITSRIFCKMCFESCWVLSKLNSRLEDIKNKISEHVSDLTTKINSSRANFELQKTSADTNDWPMIDTIYVIEENEELNDSTECEYNPDSVAGNVQLHLLATEKVTRARTYPIFNCVECSMKFPTAEYLREHTEKAHAKKPDLKRKLDVHSCEKCGETFKRHSELIIHDVDFHSRNRTKNFKCDSCDKWFANSHNLKKHELSRHPPAEIKCHICGKTFEYHVNLVHHLSTHETDNVQPQIISVVSYAEDDSSSSRLSNIPAPSEETTANNSEQEEYILGNSYWQQEEPEVGNAEIETNISYSESEQEQGSNIKCEVIDLTEIIKQEECETIT